MAYRLSLDVMLLAAAKRLLDVMRREAEGYDLRQIEEALRGKDAAQHEAAVEQLSVFALRGRSNARDLLERILEPNKDDRWAIGPWARSLAARQPQGLCGEARGCERAHPSDCGLPGFAAGRMDAP